MCHPEKIVARSPSLGTLDRDGPGGAPLPAPRPVSGARQTLIPTRRSRTVPPAALGHRDPDRTGPASMPTGSPHPRAVLSRLGTPGGTGGVDHIGRTPKEPARPGVRRRSRPCRPARCAPRPAPVVQGQNRQRRQTGPGDLGRGCLVGEGQDRGGVGEHVVDAVGRVAGIDRQVRAAAFTTASNATTRSAERSITIATSDSGPTPRAISNRASRFARPFNSSYDRQGVPETTAVASGVRATWSWNSSGTVLCGSSCALSFHALSTAAAPPRPGPRSVHRYLGVGRDGFEYRSSRRGCLRRSPGRTDPRQRDPAPQSGRGAIGVESFPQAEGQVELAVACPVSISDVWRPGRSRTAWVSFCRVSMTWNSGWRARERTG